jgi:hypothetical protein
MRQGASHIMRQGASQTTGRVRYKKGPAVGPTTSQGAAAAISPSRRRSCSRRPKAELYDKALLVMVHRSLWIWSRIRAHLYWHWPLARYS